MNKIKLNKLWGL